ncbi:XRE family transcriptional regulator [Siminovitchia sp. FSL W7-1587]|uniref:LexA family protein n=1 Tax=Siminovitchia sp. FSL W7-1587 TaxID=2954699 RepID=UPI0030D16CDC
MSRGEKLKAYIDSKGYTVMELSKRSGVAYTTIRSMIERNLSNASIDNTIKICEALGISVEDLLNEDDKKVVQLPIESSEYPYIPATVSAGLPLCIDSIEEGDLEHISIPDNLMGKWAGRSDIFLMRVNGDSMNRIMTHGSLIAVKPVSLSELKDGDIVVYSDGGDYAVKRFYQRGDKIIFKPDSSDIMFTDYETSTENEDLTIHGRVVLYLVELD